MVVEGFRMLLSLLLDCILITDFENVVWFAVFLAFTLTLAYRTSRIDNFSLACYTTIKIH